MRIVLLGPPGSGKRTQTKLLADKYGTTPLATGDLIKAAMSSGSVLGKQVEQAINMGHVVSDELVLELIRERLLQADAKGGFILDGFPRNILQEITLDELLAEIGLPIELVLLIEIETDDLMERLVGRRTCRSCNTLYNVYINPTAVEGVCDRCGGGLRHRADDNEETISSRLHVYDHLTSPLLKYYEKQQKLMRVDGYGEVGEVFERICRVIDTYDPPTPKEASSPILPAEEEQDTSDIVPSEEQQEVANQPNVTKKPALVKKKVAVKRVASKKKTVKKASGKKKPSANSKQSPVKKKPVKARPATQQKKIVARKASAKKQAPARKQAITKKKTITKKKITKKQVVKKSVPVKKKVLVKKKAVSKKKLLSKKPLVSKKKPLSKKPRVSKKTPVSKKQAVKNKNLVKKAQEKKKLTKMKPAKNKKQGKNKASAKKASRKK